MMVYNTGPLRICLLSYRSHPHCGGQGVYIKSLSRALKDLGHHVEVVSGPPVPQLDEDIALFHVSGLDLYNPDDLFRVPTLKELSDPINLIEWFGVSTMGFPEPFTFGLRAYRFLRKRLHQYDIVHDNQSLSYSLKTINKYIPTIATIHHPITVDRNLAVKAAPSLWHKIKQLRWYSFIGMQKRVSRTLSRIITVSKCAMNDIRKDFKIPFHRLMVIPNGINTSLFRPIPEIKRERDRIVVTSSADTPLKGLSYLLHAVAEISKTRKIKLVVIGEIKKNGHIEKLIIRLGIKKRVKFTGRIDHDEFILQYAKASMAIVPSVYEGFGLPAGEAMACGLPVISTTGGALPEVIGDTGILVPPRNSRALVQAITLFLDCPEIAKKMGYAGYRRVREHFTWKRAAEMTIQAYRETIRDHHRF